ncbi:MAG: SurA N-terminal domain-containing protein [Rhizobiales bacterium]|nr:SurA N-terminal domain-containing protein [Hyphomicrobiales bacterium]
MLETFRNAAQSWVAKVLMAFLVASFAIWGIKDVGNGVGESFARWTGFGPQDLVKIGDVVVSSEQFRRDLNNDLQRLAAQTGNALTLDDARKFGIDRQVLDRIIDTAVTDAKAEDLKLAVSNESIVADVAANKTFQDSKGNFDPGRFRQLLQQNGLDEARFLMTERQNRLRRTITDVGNTGLVLPRTLTEAMSRYRDETRDARYFSFTVSEADVPPPTDADLKKQYETTPAAYTAPEFRSIAAIKVEPADVAAKLTISEEEVTAAFDRYKQDYFTPERRTVLQLSFPDVAKAEAAKKRLDAGEDFMKLATEAGAKESDVTFADRTKADFLDAKIADAAFSLAEGAVSAPVSGDLTTALLKVTKVTPEVQKTLGDVRDELVKRLQLEKAKEEIQSIYDAVEDARAQQTKFEDIASKAGIPFTLAAAVNAAGVDRDGKDVALPAKAELLKAAFASDVGVENDALSLQDGYVWYEVREVIPSALKPLDEVKEQVKKDYVAGKLRDLAAEKAKAIVAKAGSATKIDTLATEANAEIKTVINIKRNDVSETFDGMAALALFAAPANSLTWSLEGDGKTARIIEVSKVNTPPFNAASNETKALADDLKLGMGEDALAAFMKAARTGVSVSINEPLWDNIRGNAAQQ